MALPSSPPLLPSEAELPSSPPLPATAFLPPPSNHRKRQLTEDESSLSSDPLFSEEPSEVEDLTSYDKPRRKRMLQGPWWRSQAAQRKVEEEKQAGFRNMDSGVFMGSDQSLSSEMTMDMPSRKRRQHHRRDAERPYRAVSRQVIIEEQPLAQQIIHKALDAGKETFDLSDLGMTQMSGEILAPIRLLIRQSHSDFTQPPSEDEFMSMIPEVKLFLANNRLTRIPPELFHLEHLHVLSLRNNKFTELPGAIRHLRKLTELNIAGNRIKVLPWELLEFMNYRDTHKQITVRPNPLLEPMPITGKSALAPLPRPDSALIEQVDDADTRLSLLESHYEQHTTLDMRSRIELRFAVGRSMRRRHLSETEVPKEKANACREELLYLASSHIRFFDITGKPCDRLPADWAFPADFTSPSEAPRAEKMSAVPSLFECAIQSVQRHYCLDGLSAIFPTVIESALKVAASSASYGNPECTSCGRKFVIARAEWVEYWYNGTTTQQELTQDTVFPFRRQACRWACARPTGIGGFRI